MTLRLVIAFAPSICQDTIQIHGSLTAGPQWVISRSIIGTASVISDLRLMESFLALVSSLSILTFIAEL